MIAKKGCNTFHVESINPDGYKWQCSVDVAQFYGLSFQMCSSVLQKLFFQWVQLSCPSTVAVMSCPVCFELWQPVV